MYQIPFHEIVMQAKKQSGFNFPNTHHIQTQLVEGEAANMICRSAHSLLTPNFKEGVWFDIADNDEAHYAMEEAIIQGCLAVWAELDRVQTLLLNSRR